MSFFESEIVQKEAEEINLKQQEIVNRLPFIPLMETDDRIEFFDAMLDLIERQMALRLKQEFRDAAKRLGMDADGLNMLDIYDKFRDNMENVRQQVLDGEL